MADIFDKSVEEKMPELRVAFVPEQVNLPFQMAEELGYFADEGIKVIQRIVPEGTGKLLSLLEDGEIDLALTVTDGFIAGKAKGRNVQLHGTYVSSPLVWAVVTAGQSTLSCMEDLKGLGRKVKFGVSRIGSGSHTMGVYAGSILGLHARDLEFVVANNLEGLKRGANNGDYDAFLWEVFTTKPFFDSGEVKQIGAVSTPWPAFSFVGPLNPKIPEDASEKGAGDRWIASAEDVKSKFFPALERATQLFSAPTSQQVSSDRIVADFGHRKEDADLWLTRAKYNCSSTKEKFDTEEGEIESSGSDKALALTPPTGARDAAFPVYRMHYEDSVEILRSVGLVPAEYLASALWKDSTIATVK